jgi:deoxyadenosine/deoxycytidine kinase
VDEWEKIKDKDGNTMLQKFYKDQATYSFAFQMMAYISRISQIKRTMENTNADIIVSERSVHTDKHVFAKMLFDSELLEDVEYQIYLNWFNEFIKDIPQSIVFYIQTNPNIAYERVQKRARPGETCDIEYLKNCHNYHDSWLIQNLNNITLYPLDFENPNNFKKVFENDLAYNKHKLAILQLNGNINIDEVNNSYTIISNALNIILNTTCNIKNN